MKKDLPIINFASIHTIYAIGIGGTVVSSLAELLAGWGRTVSGSETYANAHTDALARRGVAVTISKRIASLPHGTDLVLVSPRAPRNHPDLVLAKQWGIPTIAVADMIGMISRLHDTIAVAGAHGKTTVAAYIGTLLERVHEDPNVLVRSAVEVWGGNVRCGKGKFFVTEADENQRRFLALKPKIAVIMNIEADHLDYFKDLKAVIKAFHEFTHQLEKGTLCIVNGDEPLIRDITKRIKAKVVRFGKSDGVDVRAIGISQGVHGVTFTVHVKRSEGGDIEIALDLAGEHQIMNALAVIAVAHALGIPLERAKEVIESHRGGRRHMEVVGEQREVLVIDDAADHPSEIATVLKGVRTRYPDKKIYCVFQPYLLNRTQYLIEEFAHSFVGADHVAIMPIIKGVEEGSSTASSTLLAEAAKKYHPSVQEINGERINYFLAELPPNSTLLTLGADAVREVGERFLSSKFT